jgi:hypothetical protein
MGGGKSEGANLNLHPGGLDPLYPLQDPDRFCPRGCAMIPGVIDPISFVVIIVCKTLQNLIASILILMIFAIAVNRK